MKQENKKEVKMINTLVQLNEEKQKIFNEINKIVSGETRGKIISIKGNAGTGKSLLISHIINSFKDNDKPNSIKLLTPTNKALNAIMLKLDDELKEYMDNKSNTIASYLGQKLQIDTNGEEYFGNPNQDKAFERIINQNDELSLLVVDEASMVNNQDFMMLNRIITRINEVKRQRIEFLQRNKEDYDKGNLSTTMKKQYQSYEKMNNHPLHIVFVGDNNQLNPVNEKQNTFDQILSTQDKNKDLVVFSIREVKRQKSQTYLKFLDKLRAEISNTTYQSVPNIKVALNELLETEKDLPLDDRSIFIVNDENEIYKTYTNYSFEKTHSLLDEEDKDIYLSYRNSNVNKFNSEIAERTNDNDGSVMDLQKGQIISIDTNKFTTTVKIPNKHSSKTYTIQRYQDIRIEDVSKEKITLVNPFFDGEDKSKKYHSVEVNKIKFSFQHKDQSNDKSYTVYPKHPINVRVSAGTSNDIEKRKQIQLEEKQLNDWMTNLRKDFAKKLKENQVKLEKLDKEINETIGNKDITTFVLSVANLNATNPIFNSKEAKDFINGQIREMFDDTSKRGLLGQMTFDDYDKQWRRHYRKQYLRLYLRKQLQQFSLNDNVIDIVLNKIDGHNGRFTLLNQQEDMQKQYNTISSSIKPVSFPYGLTVHKSQGSTYQNVYFNIEEGILNPNTKKWVYDSKLYEKEKVPLYVIKDMLRLWYVGLSRHKDKLILINHNNKVKGLTKTYDKVEDIEKVLYNQQLKENIKNKVIDEKPMEDVKTNTKREPFYLMDDVLAELGLD